MSNVLGKRITLTLFGESHGSAIGATLDGFFPGVKVDTDFINLCLSKRRPNGKTDTKRVENDDYEIISGVFNGYTTGAPICMIIKNSNTQSKSYEEFLGLARPSHADYTAHLKYNGFEDYRGGGHFSGRITASIVGVGAIAIKALESLNIKISTHILECGGIKDKAYSYDEVEFDTVFNKEIPVIDSIENKIEEKIVEARNNLDSIGGVTETCILNLPEGLGEPWFDSVEGRLANAMLSIGGIKGIEFGLGFGFKDATGKTCNDSFVTDGITVKTKTNNNAGVNGGITNGMPVVFKCAVKPTPSIMQAQDTIDYNTLENKELVIKGRHDPAIIRRICIVETCLTAIVLCDMLKEKFGDDLFKNVKNNIALIGMPSSGKTTVGKLLAKSLNKKFVDTDILLEAKAGMTCKDYITKNGIDEFRKLEIEVVKEASMMDNVVISTGGGVILNKVNIDNLKKTSVVAFIDRPLELLMPTSDRPLSSNINDLKNLYTSRIGLYNRYQDIYAINDKKLDDVVNIIVREYNNFYKK